MSTTPAAPAAKVTVWQKICHIFNQAEIVSENVEVDVIPSLDEYVPVFGKAVTDLLNAQSKLRAALSTMPKGLSKEAEIQFVVGVIGQQVIADFQMVGKQLSPGLVAQMADLTNQLNNIIVSAPNITTAPTAAEIATAETVKP